MKGFADSMFSMCQFFQSKYHPSDEEIHITMSK